MSIPLQLTGKEFEALIVDAAEKLKGVHLERYGTKAMRVPDKDLTEVAKFHPDPKIRGRTIFSILEVPSLPDFDIVIRGGLQRIIEAKVCGDPGFKMYHKVIKVSQVEHMLDRAALGVPCWLLIHFTERKSSATGMTLDAAFTVALPVGDQFHPRWRNFVNANKAAKKFKTDPQPQPAITRDEARAQGQLVRWIVPLRCTKPVPDLGTLLGVPCEDQPALF